MKFRFNVKIKINLILILPQINFKTVEGLSHQKVVTNEHNFQGKVTMDGSNQASNGLGDTIIKMSPLWDEVNKGLGDTASNGLGDTVRMNGLGDTVRYEDVARGSNWQGFQKRPAVKVDSK